MDMNAINQNVVENRGNGKWSVCNDFNGRSDWFNSEAQAKAWLLYIEEAFEICLVASDVIAEVAEIKPNSNIEERYFNACEEMEYMMAEAAAEFGGGA